MTDKSPSPNAHKPSIEDERNNPVYKAGRAVVIFMSIVWAIVVIAVLYFVFKFWLS
ncbi:hypothetical protein [Neisseria weixii]|uniref:hypothetical protein n=1 Tax=Neisseria weixii TaxID=1853276 RepID=UPI0018F5ABC7|nr:hypothetical protein [Neisseria weixii]